MALGPRLDLRQSQQLVMTPQLQQAVKLLALSNLEIETFIADELARNPLLELGEGAQRDEDGGGEPAARAEYDADGTPVESDRMIAEPGGDAPLDVDYDAETFHHDCASDMGAGAGLDGSLGLDGPASGGGEGVDFEALLADQLSLRDHLLAQAGEALSGDLLFIARFLVDQIDANGYLRADLVETSRQLGVPLDRVEAALAAIHCFDPAGVGARDLAECLAIQLKDADRFDPAMARLVDRLEWLGQGKLSHLRRHCGVDDEDLADMIAEIRALDPKPGARFGGGPVQAVVPDLFVAPGEEEGWQIEINSATLPRILVNRQYYAEMRSGRLDKETERWLNECLGDANWLVRALDQRQRTIMKVAAEIVKQQDGFFRRGVSELRPLTLRDVAEAIDMHESTVSRVTSHKYLSCARGLFELKYFFSSAIQSADGGEAVSALAVKSALKALVDKETKILSDDKLVSLLKAQGFDIARRTVAKYREAMGIGSSVERRRAKKLAG